MRIFLTSLLFFTIFMVQADLVTFQEILEEAWDQDYQSLTCSDNMHRLYQRIEGSAIPYRHIYIIHIMHKHIPYAPIFGLNQRLVVGDKTYRPGNWMFHAIMYLDGYILDLDYSDRPHTIPFSRYMEKMWDQVELEQNYRFQIKKASLYQRNDFDGVMNDRESLDYKTLKTIIFDLENQ